MKSPWVALNQMTGVFTKRGESQRHRGEEDAKAAGSHQKLRERQEMAPA